MRKFILFSILFMVAMIGISQERTVSFVFDRIPTDQHYSEWSYAGTTSDYLLPTTRDSISYQYEVKRVKPYDFDFTLTYDKIAGVDTTVTVLVQGRNSTNAAWTTISTNVSNVVSGQIVQSITNSKTATIAAAVDYIQQTLIATKDTVTVAARTITYTDKTRYRYLRALCILTGNDSVGTGVKVVKVELKLWEE